MATGTRSLPTNSPVRYFQPIERGHMSEGRLSDLDSQEAVFARGMHIPTQQVNPWETTELPGGIGYPSVVTEIDRVSTYTGLDDYGHFVLKLDMVEEHWIISLERVRKMVISSSM